MRSVKNTIRGNQKVKRRPHRETGVFSKNGILRVVELHPTKGFRETNGETYRGPLAHAKETNQEVGLPAKGGNKVNFMQPVLSNTPKVVHRRSG